MKCARCNRGQLETNEYEYNNRTTRLCGNCAILTEAAHGRIKKVRGSKDRGNAPTEEAAGNTEPGDESDESDTAGDDSSANEG